MCALAVGLEFLPGLVLLLLVDLVRLVLGCFDVDALVGLLGLWCLFLLEASCICGCREVPLGLTLWWVVEWPGKSLGISSAPMGVKVILFPPTLSIDLSLSLCLL